MSEHDVLDDLLRHAKPRPVPAAEGLAAAKAAVRQEWLDATHRRSVRRRTLGLALAATVVLAAFVAVSLVQAPVVPPVHVATIKKSFGPVYLLGEQAELSPTGDLHEIVSGQTIVTGSSAGLALAWKSGGSVRVDQGTRIRFEDAQSVYVEEGRVYFDSRRTLVAGIDGGDVPVFVIRTPHGVLQHLGTQYMAKVEPATLVVSVREGSVTIDGRFFKQTIEAGQQATVSGPRRPAVLSISRSGSAWEWVSRTTPPADVDGRTLYEFLTWVSREMGLELRFEGQAEAVAHAAVLRGTVDTEPADALRLRLATAALAWRIEGESIYISDE
jgi:hypothetical protein